MLNFPETMIQLPHISSGIRRSHSVESQKFFKSKFLQCSPKDWPNPSKDWFPDFFYNFSPLSWRRPRLWRSTKFSNVPNREDFLVGWSVSVRWHFSHWRCMSARVRKMIKDRRPRKVWTFLMFLFLLKSILYSSGFLLLLQGNLYFCVSRWSIHSKEHHKVST